MILTLDSGTTNTRAYVVQDGKVKPCAELGQLFDYAKIL